MRCLLLLALASSTWAADIPKPSGSPKVIHPQGQLELLFTRSAPIEGGLTEGPAAAPDGSIYFSDIPFGDDKGMILRFDPAANKVSVFSEDSGKSNGLIFDAQGRMLACEGAAHGGRRISRWDVKTKQRETIVDRYQGKHFNSPNDICLDRQGRIYFTDPRYVGHEPRELEHRAVYRIDLDGSTHELTHEVSKPNGVVVSPDGEKIYVTDTDNGTDAIEKIDPDNPPRRGAMKIYEFPLNAKGEVSGPRKVFYDFGERFGCDGMTVDSSGRIYLTCREPTRPGVMVMNPQGKEIAFIPTGPADQKVAKGESPVGLPSNVEFGIRKGKRWLYITVDKSLYRIRLKAKGFHAQY